MDIPPDKQLHSDDGQDLSKAKPFQATGLEISCEQARRVIEYFIEDNDLKETERSLLAAHLKACAECHTHLEETQRMEARLKKTFSDIETAVDFQQKLQAELNQTAILPVQKTPLVPPAQTAVMSKARNSETTLTHAKFGPILHIAHQANEVNSEAAEYNSVLEFPTHRIETSAKQTSQAWHSRLWSLRLPLTALIFIGLGIVLIYGSARHNAPNPNADAGPSLTLLAEGESGTVRGENGVVQALPAGKDFALTPTQTVRAGNIPLKISLKSERGGAIGQVVLSAGTALRGENTHHITVLSGKAYFHIFKNRPKSSPTENFEVVAGEQATVRVTGTSFVIDMAAPEGALVIVEEGKVEVLQADNTLQVEGGHELVLGPHRQVHPSELGSRLAWLQSQPSLLTGSEAALASTPETTPKATTPPAIFTETTPLKKTFDWNIKVSPLALYGKSLPEGIEALAEKLNRPTPLLELQEQARKFANTDTLSFSTYRPLPLKSVLAWMSRDLGLRLEINADGNAFFRTVGAGQPVGPACEGCLPAEIANALKTEVPVEMLAGANTLPTFTRQIGDVCGLNIICVRELWTHFDPVLNEPASTPRAAEVLLKDLLRRAKANLAWYDHVLYLAPANQIEILTTIERRSPTLQQLLGQPLQPMWARDLKLILEQTCYPAPRLDGGPLTDELIADKPFINRLRLEAGNNAEPYFVYNTGLCGQQILETMLQTFATQTPLVIGGNSLLSQHATIGTVADLDTLVTQAREFILIESKVKSPPFSRMAFVNKGLSLGDALEWGAWLSGRGLRQENNTLLIDDYNLCYGPKQWQVLSLKALCERYPQLTTTLPTRLAQLLPKLYPSFFPDPRNLYCVQNALVFSGDRRQLRVGQSLLGHLEQALDSPRPNTPFDLSSWRPIWRIDMEKKLSEALVSNGMENFSGSFLSLLRQSILATQIHNTVLVDPAFMKDHWNDAIQEFDLKNLTVSQVIEQLATRVGLKMTLEGNVIWLKP